MRQFDEYASLASVVLQSQVVKVLPPLQAIRRNVQSQSIPACLADLKRFELSYMDAVLQTLLAFQAPTPDAESLAAGILQARRYHDQYALELARVSGSTLTPPATTLPAAPTP